MIGYVKPLIWDEHNRADVYSVFDMHRQGPKEFGVARGSTIIDYANTAEEGRLVAQADHERRVRSFVLVDDPELDATDGAHPAWWRGHEHTAEVFCKLANEIMDGKPAGNGIAGEPWESTRRRLEVLVRDQTR